MRPGLGLGRNRRHRSETLSRYRTCCARSLGHSNRARWHPLEPRSPGRFRSTCAARPSPGLPTSATAVCTIVWDTLRRYLTWSGLDVRFVSNVTDIEDKIIARAAEEDTPDRGGGRPLRGPVVGAHGRARRERPDATPHATAYVDDMVDLIGDLVAQGHAYEGGDGIYFSTESLPGYGLLAHQDLDMLQSRRPGRSGSGGGQAFPARFRPLEARRSRASPPGPPLGATAARAGTPSASSCRSTCWAKVSTSTSAVWTWSSPTTRTSVPRRSPTARCSRGGGRTTAWSSTSAGEKMSKSVGNITSLARAARAL